MNFHHQSSRLTPFTAPTSPPETGASKNDIASSFFGKLNSNVRGCRSVINKNAIRFHRRKGLSVPKVTSLKSVSLPTQLKTISLSETYFFIEVEYSIWVLIQF